MLYISVYYIRELFRPNRNLLLENMALRQQILAVEKEFQGLWSAQRAHRSQPIEGI